MTDKAVPKGLHVQEVERACPRRPPIPYIPVEDEISELVKESAGSNSFKIELPDGTKVTHSQWSQGTNEAFLIHVTSVISYCERKKFFQAYANAEKALDTALEEAKVTKFAMENLDQKASKEQKAQAKKDHDVSKALVKEHMAKMTESAEGCFALYENFSAKAPGLNGTRL